MSQRLTKAEIERRVAAFEEACRQTKLKLTSQRLEIFRELASTGKHPDAKTIFERVRRRLPTLARDTVYRTLATLEDRGLVKRLSVSMGRARFDGNPDDHHHFICTACGLVRDFYSDELDQLTPPRNVRSWGEIQGVQVQLSGICSRCRAKTKPKPRGKEKGGRS
ncbi:Fur family transcriptional regulator [Planctomycetota bacterium]